MFPFCWYYLVSWCNLLWLWCFVPLLWEGLSFFYLKKLNKRLNVVHSKNYNWRMNWPTENCCTWSAQWGTFIIYEPFFCFPVVMDFVSRGIMWCMASLYVLCHLYRAYCYWVRTLGAQTTKVPVTFLSADDRIKVFICVANSK